MVDLNPAVEAYVTESRDILEGLESALLDLEQRPDPELVDAVFRGLHTLKGGGAMFGFRLMSGFIHHFEDAFDRVRAGELAVGSDLINVVLRARDQMMAMLDCGGDGPEADALVKSPVVAKLLADLDLALDGGAPEPVAPGLKSWLIHFRPARQLCKTACGPSV